MILELLEFIHRHLKGPYQICHTRAVSSLYTSDSAYMVCWLSPTSETGSATYPVGSSGYFPGGETAAEQRWPNDCSYFLGSEWVAFYINIRSHCGDEINCNSAIRIVAWPTSPSSQLLIFLLCCMFLQKLACGLLTTPSSKFRLCIVEWQDDWSTVSWK